MSGAGPGPGTARRAAILLLLAAASPAVSLLLVHRIETRVLVPRRAEQRRLHAEAVRMFEQLQSIAAVEDHLGASRRTSDHVVHVRADRDSITAWCSGSLEGELSSARVQGVAELSDGSWRLNRVTLTMEPPPVGPVEPDQAYGWQGTLATVSIDVRKDSPVVKSEGFDRRGLLAKLLGW